MTITGITRFGVDEVVRAGLAFGIVAGDAHDVVAVLRRQRSAFSLISAWRMRSACSVSSQKTMVFWKRSPLSLRNSVILRATSFVRSSMTEGAVEVFLVVHAVLDLLAVLVGLPALGPPAFDVHVDMRLDDFVGSKEAVVDALLERVGVDRLAEVMDVGDVLRFPWAWRSGRSAWRRRSSRESRARLNLGGAAAMALVDDDEVEEVGRELAYRSSVALPGR